jgi:cystathionine gamma-synthase
MDVHFLVARVVCVQVAKFLEGHAAVEKCHYPGLPSHPGHEIAKTLMGQRGHYGGMLSFQVKGGMGPAVLFQSRVQVFKRATSLGGTESLLEHRASVEGPLSKTPNNLIRVSVGLEAIEVRGHQRSGITC